MDMKCHHLLIRDHALVLFQDNLESCQRYEEALTRLERELNMLSRQYQFYRSLQNTQFERFIEDEDTLTESLFNKLIHYEKCDTCLRATSERINKG